MISFELLQLQVHLATCNSIEAETDDSWRGQGLFQTYKTSEKVSLFLHFFVVGVVGPVFKVVHSPSKIWGVWALWHPSPAHVQQKLPSMECTAAIKESPDEQESNSLIRERNRDESRYANLNSSTKISGKPKIGCFLEEVPSCRCQSLPLHDRVWTVNNKNSEAQKSANGTQREFLGWWS